MPIYEYQGQQYDIETTDHAEAKKKILAYLGTSSTPEPTEKRNTTYGEDFQIGLGNAASTTVKGIGLLAGGLLGGLGQEDARDSIFKGTEDLAKQTQEYWTPKDAEQSFGGKVASMVSTLPAQLVAMPFSPADTGMSMINHGETVDKAQLGTLIDTLGSTVGVALPAGVGKGMLAKSITGGIGNATQDVLTRLGIQGVSETEATKKQFEPTGETTALAGILGAGFGALAPTQPHAKLPPQADPVLGKTQTFDMSLAERKTQLETAIQHDNDALTRMSAKAKLSDAEIARVERLATDLAENQRQLDALNDVVPKPDVDGIKAEELPSEKITLKPLEEIPDAEFNQKPVISEDVKQPAVKANLETTQQARASLSKQGLEDNLIDTYIEKITKGNVVETLQVLSGSKTLPIFQRVLANALAKTDLVKRSKVSIKDLGKRDGRPLAGEADWDGNIQLLKMSNVATLLHEVTHTVSMGMLRKYREGMKLGTKATAAVKSLTNLYDFVKSSEVQAKYDQYVLKHQEAGIKVPERTKETFFENVDEFLAYGTTNKFLMQFLRDLKYKKSTGLSEIVDSLSKFFGWNKQETTALAKLFEISDKIQQTSKLSDLDDFKREGTNLNTDRPLPSKDIETNSLIDSLDKRISPLGAKVNGKLFTAQLRTIYGEFPVVQKVDKILQTAERRMDSLVNDIFGGTSKADDYKKTNIFFFTLKKIQSGDGLIPAVLKNEYPEIHGVVKALQEGHDLGRSYDETLKANKFNENQTVLFNALVRMQQKLLAAENFLRASAGLKSIPARVGWFAAIRRGDHAVVISRNGVPDHLETFLSKTEADLFIKKHSKSLDDNTTMSYMKREAQDNTENVMKLFDDIQDALESGRDLNSLRGEYSTDQAGVTTHAMRRTGMPGFIGSEIGLTPAQSGKRFADNIESYVREYAESIRKREVMLGTDKALAEHKDSPNASKVAETMRDYSIGKTSEPQWLKDAGTWWKEKVDSYIVRHPFHQGKLDVHAWDRMSGFLSHIFYASTLTMRPAIAIAQVLTYFNSLRGIAREDVSPLQAMAAVGESWTALARGKYVSKDLVEGIRYVSQNLNTFHPQLTNQLNRLSFGRDPESTANQILHVLTGEKMSAGGDTVSRFMTWMTYYHVYQKMGYKGKELWEKAAEASDDNMFVYSKSHQPAIYRDLGIVGEQMSPLKTFAHGQLGLLVSDMRNFINQPGVKTAVPLALTAMMSVVFGGAISAPIVAEYELLRKLAVAMGMIDEDDFPSVTKVLLEKPEWLSHGLVSSSTGIDIGASMRYNSLVGNLVNSQNAWSALFPASGFVGTVGANTLEMTHKRIKGELTEGAKYEHLKKIVPKGPAWAAVDETLFKSHTRNQIPMRGRMESLVPQTEEAIWAARMGSRSLEEAKDSTKNIINVENEKSRNTKKALAVDLILDGNIEKGRDLLIEAQVDPKTIKSMLEAQLDRRNRPVLDRFYTNKKGGVTSYEQKRKLLEMAGYIEAKND